MIEKLHVRAFGGLGEKELEFGPGLNIISGRNEGGKSTLCGFIKAMLYGFPSLRKSDEKTRFSPWDGRRPAGTMRLRTKEGRIVVIDRDFGGRGKNALSVYDGLTGEALPELMPEPGVALYGVPLSMFEKSAFLGQGELTVKKDDEMTGRLFNLMTTLEEEVSAKTAQDKLEKLRRYLTNRTGGGVIDHKEEELNGLRAQEKEANRQGERLLLLKEEEQRAKEELRALSRRAAALENRERAERLKKDRMDLRKIEEELRLRQEEQREKQRLEQEFRNGEFYADEDYFKKWETLRGELSKARDDTARARQAKNEAAQRRQALEEEEEELQKRAQEGRQEQERGKRSAWLRRGAALVLLISGIALLLFLSGPIWKGLGLALLVGTAALLIWDFQQSRQPGRENAAEAERAALEQAGRVSAAQEEERRAQAEEQRAEQAVFQKENEGICHGQLLFSQSSAITEIGDLFNAALEKRQTLCQIIQQIFLRDQRIDDLLGGRTLEDLRAAAALPLVEEEIQDEDGSLDQARAAVLAKQREAAGLEAKRAELVGGEISAAEIAGEIARTEEELRQGRVQLAAVQLAQQTLEKSLAEVQRTFAPELNRAVGENLKRVTGGKYQNVTIDKDYQIRVETGAGQGKELFYFSGGTTDQVYLCLRLALLSMLEGEGEKMPLILDDAFSQFDDKRLYRTLETLAALAKERQILLFTCHGRESEMAKELCNFTSLHIE